MRTQSCLCFPLPPFFPGWSYSADFTKYTGWLPNGTKFDGGKFDYEFAAFACSRAFRHRGAAVHTHQIAHDREPDTSQRMIHQ